MAYTVKYDERFRDPSVIVVGCGGTGGYVAEGLCRVLPEKWTIVLQDHDVVEEHNLRRQNFFDRDLGEFKAAALADRLAQNYRRKIAYLTKPFTGRYRGGYTASLLIGCVDNAQARQAIANNDTPVWWIDSGNGHHSGQVLIGNAPKNIGHVFANNVTKYLPKPSVQLPSILIPTPEEKKKAQDCAQAVQREDQSKVINQAMAVVVLQAVDELINNRLTWMSAFINIETGALAYTPIETTTVARLCGVRTVDVIDSHPEQRRPWER